MNRAARRQPVFLHPEHDRVFLDEFADAIEQVGSEVHPYALMDKVSALNKLDELDARQHAAEHELTGQSPGSDGSGQ